MAQATSETRQFQTETKQLLDLMVHSIYTNKEIFLRELISNASDAIDKLKFEALTKPELLNKEEELHIRIEVDANGRQLKVIDNGIGMSHDEVVSNIGTIAKSGTKELIENLKTKEKENLSDLIGQFGVGFYSAFMVADQIEFVTRRAGETKATRWASTGDGEYTISEAEREGNGTTITLHLKPTDSENGLEDYTQPMVLHTIVKRYSDFIGYPIKMQEEREEVEKDDEGKPKEGGKKEIIVEDKTLNSMKPIWEKSKSQVKDEEYNEFYKHISHDWADPLRVVNLKVEGRIEYRALLFIPSKAPFDLYYRDHKSGLQLYAKRVMIMESAEELLPPYLRFVKGVVETADLDLNISREMLQQNRHINAIRKRLVKKILDTFKEIKEKESDKYLEFWREFGPAVKEGVGSDFENKELLENLLIYQSTADKEKLTSLAEYVGRMPKEQEAIYYITGETRAQLETSPHLEAFKAKGYEVLFFTDPVDEIVAQTLNEFDGKPVKSVAKGNVDLGSDKDKEKTEEENKQKTEEYKDLFESVKAALEDDVEEVRVSNRLVSSPAVLVGNEFDISPHLEKILKRSGAEAPKSKRVLELNAEHSIVKALKEIYSKKKDDERIKDYAQLLFGYAIIAEGGEMPDANKFNTVLAKYLEKGLV